MEGQSKATSWVMEHKELLYNVGAASGFVSTGLFLLHGVDLVRKGEQVNWQMMGIVIMIIISKLCGLPYKWDKRSMRINTLASLLVYAVVLVLYAVSRIRGTTQTSSGRSQS